MIDDATSDDRVDEPRSLQRPATVPLAYATTGENPLAGAVRALGFVCVVLGTFDFFILDPLSVFVALRRPIQIQPSQRTAYLGIFIASVLISFALNAVKLIAGIGAMRLRPGALRVLCVWAWCSIAYLVLGIIGNTWYSLHYSSGMLPASTIAYVVSYGAERWLHSLTVPLVTLMLLRSRSFRKAFNPGEISPLAR